MANRKRQGITNNMLEQRVRSCPASSHNKDSESEEGVIPVHEYHEQASDQKTSGPSSPNHIEQECHDNSGDGDSSSDYVNNTSEEEDYDEGLPEEEGVTYYIRYCPEDDSYLEGMDCNGEEYAVHEEQNLETEDCQEAVEEEWVESDEHRQVITEATEEQIYEECPDQVLEDIDSPLQVHLEEENGEYCQNEESYQDYYPSETKTKVNKRRVSSYSIRKGVGEVEEQEEDIDQIVAEIKMSMSMSSINSLPDQTSEDVGSQDLPQAYKEPSNKGETVHCTSRHEGRPKSLNIPPVTRHIGEAYRGLKVRARTPEERKAWQQEQVCNNPEQPRKQQRSDLNGPVDNNNTAETKKFTTFPSFVDVPGPCEPEDLIDGIIFAANYLGSTQLLSERNPSKNIRMMQAQEAVSRVKSSEGDAQTMTEVDLFISTQRIKVLNADTQETMMDHTLRTISYIADIGNIVVLMARRRMPRSASQDCIETTPGAQEGKKQYKMICHVFESEDAQLIAQSIGQAFSVAYQEFLRANGINPEDLSQKEYSDIINTQEMYNDDLIHFSNSENCKELQLEKQKGEILGVVIVESGWGSILPTVILANMMNGGPAARSGKLSIGDQIMSINGTSLVGLPLATCQGIIKGLKNQTQVKLNIVSCPPVTTVLIKRPDLKYQLGFSVQNGIICSLMRGGIAERGGVRVGHRIIEINGQSVVATAHEKIVQALSNSVGEIHMKTMPAAMFRLLTGQETPIYI
ncbi:amyloid-beta A4 precursor protein-binding family A member 2 [Latimeria chalumnae]|uniref:amyloid-beta A4 precursor protein-binding family A member 2 n=1 Tax=Latimeria chalumnae TaxID=7897 RepID=UPI0003C181EB|nr:PREDICTED: amyloid beta A4 precursor protein-binding family A member 2 [Latimeria chalumnae]|eukprot:XP_005987809.1 PREDICTED: amyloid beta A4 precursor protein-binding family A member 2 [Latimeria chalumnae]